MWLALVVGFSFAVALFAAPQGSAPAPTWRQRIESDWLLQDAKRLHSTTADLPVTREKDAAGGVDGLKDGKWGFHTEDEPNP